MIREGSAAKDLDVLFPLIDANTLSKNIIMHRR